jgi:hypothetical protein
VLMKSVASGGFILGEIAGGADPKAGAHRDLGRFSRSVPRPWDLAAGEGERQKKQSKDGARNRNG